MRVHLVLLAVMLAGCATQADPEPSEFAQLAEDSDVEVETTRTTGAVKGIVVDPAIRPLADARVTMGDRETFTDSGGGFGFSEVDPGSYFIDVEKEGYESTRLVVHVAAGMSPQWTRVVLVADPSPIASFELHHYAGMIGSSVIVYAGGFRTGYTAWDPVTGANMNHRWDVARPVDFLQLEIAWEPNLPIFGDVWVGMSASNEARGASLGHAVGGSPLVVSAAGDDVLEALGGGIAEQVGFVVFAGYSDPASVSIAVQQDYDAYLHVFHGFVPPPTWTFVQDGPPA